MSSADTVWITIPQWHSYARRLERRHLRQYGTSLAATAIARRASAYIVEIQSERIRVCAGWRRAMQQAAEAHPCAPDLPTHIPHPLA